MIIRLDLAEQVAEIYRDGKLVTVRDIAPFMERKNMTLPPAITRSGDAWHLGRENRLTGLTEIAVIHNDTPLTSAGAIEVIGGMRTVRDAACAVQAHNMVEEIVAAHYAMDTSPQPKEVAETLFFSDVISILRKFGRAT